MWDFHTLNEMPFAVAEMVFMRSDISGNNRSSTIVDAEDKSAIDHLKEEEVSSSVNRHEDTRITSWSNLHTDVNIETNTEVLHCT